MMFLLLALALLFVQNLFLTNWTAYVQSGHRAPKGGEKEEEDWYLYGV